MVIENLTLHNFRNYEEERFTFEEGLNVLTGRNAQGKTNCAEAVFYLCTGASLRIRHDRQLIRRGAPSAHIAARVRTRFGVVQLMALFLDDAFEPEHLRLVARIERPEYYINMARAWYYSFALIKQPEATLPLFEADFALAPPAAALSAKNSATMLRMHSRLASLLAVPRMLR